MFHDAITHGHRAEPHPEVVAYATQTVMTDLDAGTTSLAEAIQDLGYLTCSGTFERIDIVTAGQAHRASRRAIGFTGTDTLDDFPLDPPEWDVKRTVAGAWL